MDTFSCIQYGLMCGQITSCTIIKFSSTLDNFQSLTDPIPIPSGGDSYSGPRRKYAGSSSSRSLPKSIDVSGLTDAEKEAKAVNEKNKGNESFAAGDFDEAVLYYTRAISVKPTTPFYNNR